jgi:hypothetical protein
MSARLILLAALALATLGMAIVVFAVLSPGLFFAGVYMIDAALAALAIAGVLYLMAPAEQA